MNLGVLLISSVGYIAILLLVYVGATIASEFKNNLKKNNLLIKSDPEVAFYLLPDAMYYLTMAFSSPLM